MKETNKKTRKNIKESLKLTTLGFTLVELLAVIVILAIILVIAVPKVINVIDDAKKATLESTAKMIAGQAEKQKVQNTLLGKTDEITCDSVAKINDVDYASCEIMFEKSTAKVTIEGSGKFDGLYVCNGTKIDAVAIEYECPIEYGIGSTYIEELLLNEDVLKNGLIKDDTIDKNIRYAGAISDVKNKVYFNCAETDGTNAYGSKNYNYENSCEIWRIIGVFNTYSNENDNVGEKRIKIVRDEVLSTAMVWGDREVNDEYINQWGETTLTSDNTTIYPGAVIKRYLNDGVDSYYNSLTSIAKGQISDALWYTGSAENSIVSNVYLNEKGDITGGGETVNYTTKWVGKVGLIYPSDFGYAGTNCGGYTIYMYYHENSCGRTRNWLTPSKGDYWTISPYTSGGTYSYRAWLVSSYGGAEYTRVGLSYDVRPSLYLSSNVEIIGGNGGTEPFKLK